VSVPRATAEDRRDGTPGPYAQDLLFRVADVTGVQYSRMSLTMGRPPRRPQIINGRIEDVHAFGLRNGDTITVTYFTKG
jgi:hypothetical protein